MSNSDCNPQVAASRKLPALYLVDSIIKNVSSCYPQLFSNNLPSIFVAVFEKVITPVVWGEQNWSLNEHDPPVGTSFTLLLPLKVVPRVEVRGGG